MTEKMLRDIKREATCDFIDWASKAATEENNCFSKTSLFR